MTAISKAIPSSCQKFLEFSEDASGTRLSLFEKNRTGSSYVVESRHKTLTGRGGSAITSEVIMGAFREWGNRPRVQRVPRPRCNETWYRSAMPGPGRGTRIAIERVVVPPCDECGRDGFVPA